MLLKKKFLKIFFISTLFNLAISAQKKDNLKLIDYHQSTCDQSVDPYRIKPRIISYNQHKDTLDLEIGFATTCCIEYIPDLKFANDTLSIKYNEKEGSYGCSCICCYSFNHKIKGINSSKITVKLENEIIQLSDEKYKTYEPTFTVVKNDTINLTDKYGFKQGLWTFGTIFFERYKDNKRLSTGKFFKNKNIKDEYFYSVKIKKEYYTNGKLKSECNRNDKWEYINCRKWRRNGKEIKN